MILFQLEPWQMALVMLPVLLNLWAIWHVFTHSFPGEMERPLWMVATVFLPFVGGLLYVLFGLRRSRPRESG